MKLKRLMASFLLLGLLAACGTTTTPETALTTQALEKQLTVSNPSSKYIVKWTGNRDGWRNSNFTRLNILEDTGTRVELMAVTSDTTFAWEGCDANSSKKGSDGKFDLYCTAVMTKDKTVTFRAQIGSATFNVVPASITSLQLTIEGNGKKYTAYRGTTLPLPIGTYTVKGGGYDSSCNCSYTSDSQTFSVSKDRRTTVTVFMNRN